MFPGGLRPEVDDVSGPFWAGCAQGRLLVQTCAACNRARMPPRPMCPQCRSLESTWAEVSGRGRIWSFVVAHPPLLEAYAAVAPYNVIVVELDDDPTVRFVGNLVADTEGSPSDVDRSMLKVGQTVRVGFAPADDGPVMPCWLPADP